MLDTPREKLVAGLEKLGLKLPTIAARSMCSPEQLENLIRRALDDAADLRNTGGESTDERRRRFAAGQFVADGDDLDDPVGGVSNRGGPVYEPSGGPFLY